MVPFYSSLSLYNKNKNNRMILYNPIKNTLSNGDITIKIGYRESQILTLLLDQSPEVVKKQDIVQYAWGNEYIGETSLAKSISVLRQGFVKVGVRESPIVTVPKIGYRLVKGVLLNECLIAVTPSVKTTEAIREDTPTFTPTIKHESNYKSLACYILSLGILFAASLVGASKFHSKYNHPQRNNALKEHSVGMLEVYTDPNTQLSVRLGKLLTKHQCVCVVYIEENDQFSEMSWLNKQTRKSINVFYTQTQFEQASETIAQFIAEENR
ncbi:Transcriptional regulator [Vibrio jasicida]|uniref:Transcriptional regulator n=2 Tax=Vibrionaceae TaxID=641 RepID=A0AAU9QL13_9VIBR|nr:Transcriptional regulator [Vibrio jasicida]CAH1580630.1 Transcriptional regulator [Vibrio jasicida]